MENIQNQIERNRLRLFGDVTRMDENKKPKRVLDMKMNGKIPRGRSQTWWPDQVKAHIDSREQSWKKVEEMQEQTDRDSWRLLCKR
jgi:hypothetical protein